MTLHGVCLPTDPAQMPLAHELAPFGLVRIVATDTPEFYATVRDYQQHGLIVPVVLAWETFGGSNDPAVWADTCDRLARNCFFDLAVIGNEADNLAPSASSWVMTPAAYARLWVVCERALRGRQPHVRLCIAGQVSGLPWRGAEYVRAVERAGGHPDSIDIHPYSKGPAEAETLLGLYREAIPHLKLQVLEWNRPAGQTPDFVRMLERVGVEYAAYFSWLPFDTDALLDEQGNRTDRYESYTQALSEAPQPEPIGVSMTIEQREQAADWPLGKRWQDRPVVDLGKGVRIAGYEYGVALELGGDVWQLLHSEQRPNS